MLFARYEPGANAKVRLRPATGKLLLLLCASLIFVAIGALMIVDGKLLWGWLGVGFFGAGSLVFVMTLLPGAAGLKLTPEGFEVTAFFRTRGRRWRDIDRFGLQSVSAGHIMVGYNYLPDCKTARKRGALAGALSCDFDGYLPDSYGLKPEQLAAILELWRGHYSAGGADA